MKILVTGAGGMLARALVPELRSRQHEVVALEREALDVTDCDAVQRRIAEVAPQVVVQCAAYTAVDAAEADAGAAFRINAEATGFVAEACQKVAARFVYPSTDYVFAGNGSRPYLTSDPTAPVNTYGRSKLAGEQAALKAPGALVVRTSWLYGGGGANFVDTMLRLARERDRLQVVDDQIGRPTWTGSLAAVLSELIEKQAYGIFHATDGGEPTSWFGFARQIFRERSLSIHVEPVETSAFPRPARRPGYSVLDCTATEAVLRRPLPDWQAVLRQYLGGNSLDKD